MNRHDASKIAKTITNEQIQQMLDTAKKEIKNWKVVSNVNKGLTKGTAWNILAKNFDVNKEYPHIALKNMVWEFGDYLPEELKIPKKEKHSSVSPIHQEPEL